MTARSAPLTPALVTLAHQLVDATGPILRQYFRANYAADRKADASPVTIVDRTAETRVREILAKQRPEDGIWGEEMGATRLDAEWVWVLDPLDGTRAFMAGKPMFATLLGLLHRGVPVLGLLDQPVSGERWVGGVSVPATYNDQPIRTRHSRPLDACILNATTPAMFVSDDAHAMQRLCAAVADPLWGGDAYAYGLLAMGHIDVVVEAQLKPHDYCALAPLVQAAGGVMTDWQGQPLTLASDGRIIACGDAALLPVVQKILTAAST